jgi:hypothetical protein
MFLCFGPGIAFSVALTSAGNTTRRVGRLACAQPQLRVGLKGFTPLPLREPPVDWTRQSKRIDRFGVLHGCSDS